MKSTHLVSLRLDLSILSVFNSTIKPLVKLNHRFLLNTFLFSKISFWYFHIIINMIKFTRIAYFNLNSHNIWISSFFFLIHQRVWIVNLQEININISIYTILVIILLKYLLQLLPSRSFNNLLILFNQSPSLLFRLFRKYSSHNIVMHKIQKTDFLLSLKLNSFRSHHLVLILLHPHKHYSSSRIQKTHNSLSKMIHNRLIRQRPVIILEFLIVRLPKFLTLTLSSKLEMNATA